MKAWIPFLCVVLFLPAMSTSRAQQDQVSPENVTKVSRRSALVYSELDKAPEKDRFRRNPFEDDPEAPIAGQKLFVQHCAGCHGHEAAGGRYAPPLRIPEVQNAPPGAIFWLISNGIVRKGMPVWSKLPEPQRWQLITYLKSLSKASKQATRPES